MSSAGSEIAPTGSVDLWPQVKVRAGICGLLGTLSGFALFLDLRGNGSTEWAAWFLGLVVASVIAYFIDAMRQTMDAEVHGSRANLRTIATTLTLLLVFEVFTSAADELVTQATSDYGLLKVAAEELAGASWSDRLVATPAMLAEVAPGAAAPGAIVADDPSDPKREIVQRIFDRMPLLDQFLLAPQSRVLSPGPGAIATVDALNSRLDQPPSYMPLLRTDPGVLASGWLDKCPVFYDPGDLVACAAGASTLSSDVRIAILERGLGVALEEPDLYDPSLFSSEASHRANEDKEALGHIHVDELLARAQAGLDYCNRIRSRVADAQPNESCLALAPRDPGREVPPFPAPLQVNINRDLLALFLADFPPAPTDWSGLLLVAGVWTMTGIGLALLLTRRVLSMPLESTPALDREAMKSGAKALLLAGGLVVGGLLLMRLGQLAVNLLETPPTTFCNDQWIREDMPALGAMLTFFAQMLLFLVPNAMVVLDHILPPQISMVLAFAGVALLTRWAWRHRNKGPAMLLLLPAVGVVLLSLGSVSSIFWVALLTILSWLSPAIGLAIMLPHLRPGGTMPAWLRIVVAVAVAAILFVWTAFRLAPGDGGSDDVILPVLIVVSVGILLTDLFMFGRFLVREIWVFYVLAVGFLIFGLTRMVQATFVGVLRTLPAALTPVALPTVPCTFDFSWGNASPVALSATDVQQAMSLELDLVGGLGFWLTLAILATWSMRDQRGRKRATKLSPPV